jgi:SAM-dependent methyltransferase
MIDICPICSSEEIIEIFQEDNVPVFQNKIYPTEKEARLAELGSIRVVLCRNCGFAWNASFDREKLQYDSKYQNEQSCSGEFRRHLDSVMQIIQENNPLTSHIIEIGCGKGTFLNLLYYSGYRNVLGFDPAYEGDAPFIQKCYYPPSNNCYSQADLFIMRHVLEHVPDPLNFLKKIDQSNRKISKIYIEVPSFEWIARNGAFWDLSYEHCNYFNRLLLGYMLPNCETGYLFGDQYLYATGDFIVHTPRNINFLDTMILSAPKKLKEKLEFCNHFIKKHSNLALWGGGAKGANFARIMDPDREKILCIVDINKRKQGYYIARSAHPIISPEDFVGMNEVEGVIIMNENYLWEIKSALGPWRGDCFVLDRCLMKF